MPTDTKPILLRPSCALADALAAEAAERGCSRQVFMLDVLAEAVADRLNANAHDPDDVPLPGV